MVSRLRLQEVTCGSRTVRYAEKTCPFWSGIINKGQVPTRRSGAYLHEHFRIQITRGFEQGLKLIGSIFSFQLSSFWLGLCLCFPLANEFSILSCHVKSNKWMSSIFT